MRDFLTFRKMLTPWLIQLICWLGIGLCIASAGYVMIHNKEWVKGLETLFLGPILVRISCEFIIVVFRMNETLTEINHHLEAKHNAKVIENRLQI